MTPAARIASAIEILDAILAGEPAEKQLTTWGRKNRYAGSKDRAAVRDLVFESLRCKQSFAILGGADTGRGILIGLLKSRDDDPSEIFTGEGYAPAPLSDEEIDAGQSPTDEEALDAPEWLVPRLKSSLGEVFPRVFRLLHDRAPVFLRVNLKATTRDEVIKSLAKEDIIAEPQELSPAALLVTKNPRRVQNSKVYLGGLVELQDAASQRISDLIPLPEGGSVLDFCAGGGGKTLALAARDTRGNVNLFTRAKAKLRRIRPRRPAE